MQWGRCRYLTSSREFCHVMANHIKQGPDHVGHCTTLTSSTMSDTALCYILISDSMPSTKVALILMNVPESFWSGGRGGLSFRWGGQTYTAPLFEAHGPLILAAQKSHRKIAVTTAAAMCSQPFRCRNRKVFHFGGRKKIASR